MRKSLLIVTCFLLIINLSIAQNKLNLDYEPIITSIQTPWGIDWLPNGEMLVTDRSGKLYSWANGELKEITGVPEVVAEGQGGLLDVKVHPKYEENGWIYFSFSKAMGKDNQGKALVTTAIVRAKLQGNKLVELAEVFKAEPAFETRRHYGSRIVFDNEGYLYFSIGDRGKREINPQSLNNHCGKIHRINDDGSIPKDNPFIKNPVAMPSIYSFGHRNPQGLVYNNNTNTLWEHEHGPKGGDEVNIIQKGKNYGWPVISYGINYNGTAFTDITKKEGMEQPEIFWVPSIAPSGMDFVTSNKYPGLKGDLLVGSLSFQYLHRCKVVDGKITAQEEYFKGIGRVRVIKQAPDGYIYFGVEGKGIMKLISKE